MWRLRARDTGGMDMSDDLTSLWSNFSLSAAESVEMEVKDQTLEGLETRG